MRSATNQIEHPRQGRVEVLGLGASALGHVGASASLATDRLRQLADDLPGCEAATEVRRHHRHERDLVALDARQDDDAGTELVAQLVGDLAQRLRVGHIGAGREYAYAAHVARLRREIAPAARRELAAQLLDLLFLFALLGL